MKLVGNDPVLSCDDNPKQAAANVVMTAVDRTPYQGTLPNVLALLLIRTPAPAAKPAPTDLSPNSSQNVFDIIRQLTETPVAR